MKPNVAGTSSPAESNEAGAAKQPGKKADHCVDGVLVLALLWYCDNSEDGVLALLVIKVTRKISSDQWQGRGKVLRY